MLDQGQSEIRRSNDSTLWDNIHTFTKNNIVVKEGVLNFMILKIR